MHRVRLKRVFKLKIFLLGSASGGATVWEVWALVTIKNGPFLYRIYGPF